MNKSWPVRNRLKPRLNVVTLGIVLILAGVGTAFAGSAMTLYVGEVKVIQVKPVNRVAVGNGDLVSTSITKDGQLILLAEGEGDTGMHIWYTDGSERDYQITVEPSNTGRAAVEIAEFLETVSGVSLRTVAGKNVLEGQYEPRHKPIVEAIVNRYPAVLNLTTETEVPHDKMIYFHVVITEFNTGDISSLGITWSDSIQGPAATFGAGKRGSFNVPPAERGAAISDLGDGFDVLSMAVNPSFGFVGMAGQIMSTINFMVEDNRALVLAEPRLAARSGGSAKFLVGGEVPIATVSQNGTNVEFKPFGIKLEIEPVVDDFGNIRSSIMAEVSAVDNSIEVQGTPGFRTRTASTEVSMRAGETLVISGLVDRQLSKTIGGIYGLKDIPYLGRLFRNEGWDNTVSELVIFVTPTVVDARAEINLSELKRQQRMLEQFSDETGYDLLLE